jgi:hypothetical protein
MAKGKRSANSARISKMRQLSNSVSKRNSRIHGASSTSQSTKGKKSS